MITDIQTEQELLRIGHNLQTIRAWAKEKLEATADAVGTTHSVLSKIENGKYEALTIVLLIKLCNHFKVRLEEVLDLGLVQIWKQSQINHAGTTGNTLKNIEHEVASGYEKALEQSNNEILYLRKKLDDLQGGKG